MEKHILKKIAELDKRYNLETDRYSKIATGGKLRAYKDMLEYVKAYNRKPEKDKIDWSLMLNPKPEKNPYDISLDLYLKLKEISKEYGIIIITATQNEALR